MSLEGSLRAYLLANQGVSDALNGQLFPHEAPGGVTYPYGVYRLASIEKPRFLDGRVRYEKRQYEIQFHNTNYDDSKTMAAAVLAAVGGMSGGGVQGQLGAQPVVMFWADSPEEDDSVSAVDGTRYHATLNLTILLK